MEEEKGEEEIRLKIAAYLGYPPPPPSRKVRSRPIFQEVTRLAAEDRATGAKCVDWLQSLSPKERWRAISIRDPWFAWMLREMFRWKVERGELVFEFVESEDNGSQYQGFNRYFYQRNRNSAAERDKQMLLKQEYEREIEQRIRIGDSASYLDTLTVDYQLAEDLPHFLSLMSTISDNKAFTSPCLPHLDPSRQWYFDSPIWLFPSFNSLAIWACAWLERGIWINYWKATGLPQRAKGEYQGFPSDSVSPMMGCLEATGEMWRDMDEGRKDTLLREIEQYAKTFDSSKMRIETFMGLGSTKVELEFTSGKTLRVSNLNKSQGNYYQKHYSLIEHNNESSSISDLRAYSKLKPDLFVQFLALSSLDRVLSLLDICCRHLVLNLYSIYNSQVASLLFSELQSSPPKPDHPKDVKKKKKAKSKAKPETAPAIESQTEPDPSLLCLDLVKTVVDSALNYVGKERSASPAATSWPFVSQPNPSNILSKIKELNPTSSPNKSKKPKKKKPKRNKKNPQSDVIGGVPSPVVPKRPPTARLHSEIQAFCAGLAERLLSVKPERDALIAGLMEVCKGLFPESELRVYGSYPLNIALETSDIDTVVVSAGTKEVGESLKRLGRALQGREWVTNITVIDTASVPIVKLETMPPSGLLTKIDITFDDREPGHPGTHLGLERFAYTQKLLRDFPPLREVTLVLKQILALHGMNSAYKGYLSSYSLLLWVAARLLSIPFPSLDLAQLLSDFLTFYSYSFDPLMMGIDITLPQYSLFRPYFCLAPAMYHAVTIDPVAENNNTTWNAYNLKEVVGLFRRCEEKMRKVEKVSLEEILRVGL